MVGTLERFWVSFQDTDAFRQFVKHGAGARLFRSHAYRDLRLRKHYLTSLLATRFNAAEWVDVQTLCLFVGHNKSGTSMLGSLLDAHPEVILADEADALAYIEAGFNAGQLFHVLRRASRHEALKGRVTARRLQAYSWSVPGQWQGRYRQLRVVGDSTSGTTTRRLGRDPGLLARLERQMGDVAVRFILVIRNPFDPISFIMVRGKRSFENAIDHYFANCESVAALRDRLGDDRLLPMRYEAFIRDPRRELTAVCHFLGLDAPEDYLDACTAILHETPEKGRHLVPWDAQRIRAVEERMAPFDFLQGYTFARGEWR